MFVCVYMHMHTDIVMFISSQKIRCFQFLSQHSVAHLVKRISKTLKQGKEYN